MAIVMVPLEMKSFSLVITMDYLFLPKKLSYLTLTTHLYQNTTNNVLQEKQPLGFIKLHSWVLRELARPAPYVRC